MKISSQSNPNDASGASVGVAARSSLESGSRDSSILPEIDKVTISGVAAAAGSEVKRNLSSMTYDDLYSLSRSKDSKISQSDKDLALRELNDREYAYYSKFIAQAEATGDQGIVTKAAIDLYDQLPAVAQESLGGAGYREKMVSLLKSQGSGTETGGAGKSLLDMVINGYKDLEGVSSEKSLSIKKAYTLPDFGA